MYSDDLLTQKIKELNTLYSETEKQLFGIRDYMNDINRYAKHLFKTGDFPDEPHRLSNDAWRKRASEMIKELMKVEKAKYPSFNSVLIPIYIKLRDVYGVVLEQLRKDFRNKYDTLRYPSAFEAISGDDTVRDIFDSILIGLFPDDYFIDETLEIIERGEAVACNNSPDEVLKEIISPLALKNHDDSFGYSKTFEFVCENMECSWNNLQTRYKNKNHTENEPSKLTIIITNEAVFRKFKKTVRDMLEKCCA